jgi:uncharacterized protein (DUF2132 family)
MGDAPKRPLQPSSDRINNSKTQMTIDQPNNPLHGKTLEAILEHLVAQYGWKELGLRIRIRCFTDNPSIKSSLKFLRKTPWARKKVESLYLESIEEKK